MFKRIKIREIQIFISLILYISSFKSVAQVKIALSPGSPNSSAMLDLESGNHGFLLPRVALTSSNMLLSNTTPEDGMVVFNTNNVNANNLQGMGVYIYYANSWRLLVQQEDLEPVGAYKYACINEVAGYLKCDGSAVSRTIYAELFALIGTSFGSGDGTNTFNLPDFRGCIFGCIGAGPGLTQRMLGSKIGSETNNLVESQMPLHQHIESLAATGNDGSFGNTGATKYLESISGTPNQNASLGWSDYIGGSPHNEMQPTIFAGNFFIRY
ncbi:MAG: tail fiber protein [Pedobacter agri]